MQQLELVIGTVEHVMFHNEQNGYTVAKIIPESEYHAQNPDGTLTIIGNFTEDTPKQGVSAEFTGYWIENPQYGTQFKVQSLKRISQRAATVPNNATADTAILRAIIARMTYYNPENGWGVVKVEPIDDNFPEEAMSYEGVIAVVGVMPELVEGETAEFTGRWVTNEQYGKQFKAEQVIPIAPQNADGIIRYIADTVFGIGDVTATRIYKHFGDKTMEILDMAPERIREVPKLKPNLADNLIAAWGENRVLRQTMIYLQGYGVSSRMAKKIFDEYGTTTLQVVQTNPYQLADDVHGIGFKKADEIAQGMGIPVDAPHRLRAGLVYTLSQMANDGHTYSPREKLLEEARDLLSVAEDIDLNQELNAQLLDAKLKADAILLDGDPLEVVYLPMYYHSEVGSTTKLRVMAESPSKIITRMKETDWARYLSTLAEDNNVDLTPQQQSAVQAALTSKLSILTGGPGTGKTTTLRMVINALDQEGFEYKLASPTGRAAKRLAEATGQPASTIHRMLGWNPQAGGFEYDEDHPLECDVLIVDEASMIDLLLLYSLLKALKPATHLMLVGDVDQLPSVGAGNVLNDIINSNRAHVTRLNQIFRQDDDSHIITNAHRINNGDMPYTNNQSRDFFFFGMEDPAEAAEMVVEIVTERLKNKIGDYNPIEDVQVIAPMYRGAIGVNALNQALQETLNPSKPHIMEKRIGGRVFRRGDKVMQTKNDYDKDVFNGDIGYVYGIDSDEGIIEVMIDGAAVSYRYDDADEQLIHAYCISTHRSQGSEYPIVVMPVMPQHYMMLQRNLLYTAITRAKQMVVLVGARKALAMAVNNNKVSERYSGLLPRLLEAPSTKLTLL